jgi:branched-chain amino acid transport system permease protein
VLSFFIGVLAVGAIYGLMSVSLNLQEGVTGLSNFGVVAFFGLGAYATGIAAAAGASALVGILAGVAVAAIAGALVGALGRTLAAEYWAMVTLALAELLRLLVMNTDGLTRGPRGIDSFDRWFPGLTGVQYDLAWLALAGVVLAACALLAGRVVRGQFGRAARVIRENESLAASLGHDVVRTKVKMMAFSAPMAALSGSLYTHYSLFIGPEQLQPFVTYLVYTMVIVGGLGSMVGAVVGAFVVNLIYAGSRFVDDVVPISANSAAGVRILLVGVALLLCLMFRPAGLIPERLRKFDARS